MSNTRGITPLNISLSTFKYKLKAFLLYTSLLVSVSGGAMADESTNRHFMTLSEGQRAWYYTGAFTSLAHIATGEYGKKKADCVWDWYFQYPEKRQKQLEESFKQYPDAIPTSVILALLKRDCGVF